MSLNSTTNSNLTNLEGGKTYLLAPGNYSINAAVLLNTESSICFIGTSPADVTISTIGAGAMKLTNNGAMLGLQGLTLDEAQSNSADVAGVVVSAGILTARDVVMQGYKQRSALYATGSPADIKLDSVVFRNNNVSALGTAKDNVVFLATTGRAYEWTNVSIAQQLKHHDVGILCILCICTLT